MASPLLSVDLETSGTLMGASPIIAIGACVVSRDWAAEWGRLPAVLERAKAHRGPFLAEPDLFYCELRPDPWAVWVEDSVQYHHLTLEHLQEHGTLASEALAAFSEWVRATGGSPRKKRALVSHNAAFDWAHLGGHFVRYGVQDPFGPFPVCTKNIARGRFRDPTDEMTGQTAMAPRLGMPPHLGKHNALADALSQAVLYTKLMAP